MTRRRSADQDEPSPRLDRGGPREPDPSRDPRSRRVRFTLDLSSEQHRFLKRFAFEAETDASVVMRLLLTLLQGDEKLARRVLSELE